LLLEFFSFQFFSAESVILSITDPLVNFAGFSVPSAPPSALLFTAVQGEIVSVVTNLLEITFFLVSITF